MRDLLSFTQSLSQVKEAYLSIDNDRNETEFFLRYNTQQRNDEYLSEQADSLEKTIGDRKAYIMLSEGTEEDTFDIIIGTAVPNDNFKLINVQIHRSAQTEILNQGNNGMHVRLTLNNNKNVSPNIKFEFVVVEAEGGFIDVDSGTALFIAEQLRNRK